MRTLVLGVLVCTLLCSCSLEVPALQRCVVRDATAALDAPAKAELSPAQLRSLERWFSTYKSGWETKVVDLAPSGLVFEMYPEKGRVIRGNLREREVWVGGRRKMLSPAERYELLHALGDSTSVLHFSAGN